jgi:GT2 family glycosyltransferase
MILSTNSRLFGVSVIIPVYNRPNLLEKVLRGLEAQSISADVVEVFVCDDGSTEDVKDVVDKYKKGLPHLKYLYQHNQGPAAARNLGTRQASAEFVIYLDSDVLPEPDFIEKLLNEIQKHPEWVGAEGRVLPCGGDANLLWDAPVCDAGGVYLTAAIIYRRDVLEKIGGFDQAFLRAACEDVELAARAMKYGKIGFVRDAVVHHPRRRKTFRYYWDKRRDWRYVLFLALRHDFIAWPANPTRSPRLKLIWCALVTQPGGRLLGGLRLFTQRPGPGLIATVHALFSWLCGMWAVPDILFASEPPVRDYLKENRDLAGEYL